MTPEVLGSILEPIVHMLVGIAPPIAAAIIDAADPETRARIVALQVIRDAQRKLPQTGATRAGVDAIFARAPTLAPPAMPLPTDSDEIEGSSPSDEGEGA